MKFKISVSVIAALLAFSSSSQAAEIASIKVGYMLLAPSGHFAAMSNGVGTQIDTEGDLNLNKSGQITGELTVDLGDSLISFGVIPLKFGGAGSLPRAIDHNGQNFAVGTIVQSSLKANVFDLGYSYYLLNSDELAPRFQLGVELSAKVIALKSNVSSGVATSNKSTTVVIPTVGLRGKYGITDIVNLSGRVGYMGYAGNSFTDIDTQFELSIQPTLGIYAGYRYLKMKLDSEGVLANVTLRGPYAGAFFRF